MMNLLRADFRRIRKDKLLLVMGILAVAFALITPLLYSILFSSTDVADDPMVSSMLSGYITAKSQFFASFSLGNNLGLAIPILLAIILCKDFSYGTIRNKIIAGKSRSAIFMSLFISCSVLLTAVMLLHAFMTLFVSLIFFDYQATPFTLGDFGYFLASLAFEILILLCIAALLSWLCAVMKNVGLVIVLYVAFIFALIIIGSILQVVIGVMEMTGGDESTLSILRFFDRINIASAASYIGMGNSYSIQDVLYFTLPSLLGIAGFGGLGLMKFRKKDLK